MKNDNNQKFHVFQSGQSTVYKITKQSESRKISELRNRYCKLITLMVAASVADGFKSKAIP